MSRRVLVAYAVLLFLLVLLRTAWLSDHAYLALRTADNAAWGLGFRWNADERAQVFDHPLWMLCLYLVRLLTGEVYYGTLVLSIVCATAAAWLLIRRGATDAGIVVAALLLTLSPSFMTYSTSGLGTPLLHLLMTGFVLLALRDDAKQSARHRIALTALAALAALTDPMTMVVTVPVVWAMGSGGQSPSWIERRGQSPSAAPGTVPSSGATEGTVPVTPSEGTVPVPPASPLLWLSPILAVAAWAALAVLYYGSLLPLPMLARLHQDITIGDRLHAGLQFLGDAVTRDPVLAGAVALGLALPFIRRTSERLLAGAALAYTVVLIASGGSTWSAYGLTIPFLIAVLVIARQPILARRAAAVPALAAVVLVGALTPVHTIASHAQYGLDSTRQTGIVDPRAEDYQATGLLRVRRNQWFPDHPESERGVRAGESRRPIASSRRPGFFGYAAGRTVHVVDATGLGDPLLSRLPPREPPAPGQSVLELRPRATPDGYVESLIANRNLLADPALSAMYERIRFVTRGRLWEHGRTANAIVLALGRDAWSRTPISHVPSK